MKNTRKKNKEECRRRMTKKINEEKGEEDKRRRIKKKNEDIRALEREINRKLEETARSGAS
jgi:hypothetical protein